MRLFLAPLALVAAVSLPLSPAVGQSPGMQVVDTAGGVVGTVTAVQGDIVTIKTDRHEVALPKASFTPHQGKLLFGMTQAELNAATDRSLAEAAAALVAGAEVKGSAGTRVGAIEAIDAEFVTIKLDGGQLVRLPRSGIAAGANGAVIGLTAEQLAAQVPAEAPTETADSGGK